MTQVLIVEDERPIARLIEMSLSRSGYACTVADDGLKAADLLEDRQFDLALLDIMLPGLDGLELLDYLKPLGVPVIFITAKASVRDRVEGLRRGADDYLVKPVRMEELLLRLEAILRRRGVSAGTREVTIGPYTLNEGTLCVEDAQKKTSVPLRLKEFRLLCKLAGHPGKIFTRQELMDDVWGYDSESDSRTVDTHVKRLREKLEALPEIRIQTVRGLGYRVEKIKS